MIINKWNGPALRVTEEDDTFFNAPLAETTLYRFVSDSVVVEPHEGAFSIKLATSGREEYEFDGGREIVTPEKCIVVNAGERYASEVRSLSTSLSVFYRDEEVRAACRDLRDDVGALLERPDARGECVTAPRLPLPMNRRLKLLRTKLDRAAQLRDAAETEMASRLLLVEVLRCFLDLPAPEALQQTARPAIRKELVRRVHQAKIYIDDHGGQNCRLNDLAAIACLSKYHFLRVFREAYGETPVAYARQRRLDIARARIAQGVEKNIAAQRAGFSNLRAFDRAFRRQFGDSPAIVKT